jgi:hypothetical protein
MTMVSCGLLPTPAPLGAAAVGTTSLIDSNNELAWGLHVVQKSGGGNISHVHFRTGTVTTGATVDVRVETPDGSGQPSGTLWGTNTNASQVIADANDNVLFRTALTSSAVVGLGDTIAVMVKNHPTDFGSLNINRAPITIGGRGFPYPGGPLASDKNDNSGPPFAIEYDDGTIELPAGMLPGCCTPAALSISTGTNPDEIGLHWTQNFKARCVGWWCFISLLATGITYRISLYAASSNTPLATCVMDSDATSSTAARMFMGAWDDVSAGITLDAGTAYRVTFVALSASAVNVYRVTAERNAWFSSLGLPGGQETARNRSGTSDPDSASWTETATRRPEMGIVLDQVDDGAGSGGLAYPVSGRVAA